MRANIRYLRSTSSLPAKSTRKLASSSAPYYHYKWVDEEVVLVLYPSLAPLLSQSRIAALGTARVDKLAASSNINNNKRSPIKPQSGPSNETSLEHDQWKPCGEHSTSIHFIQRSFYLCAQVSLCADCQISPASQRQQTLAFCPCIYQPLTKRT